MEESQASISGRRPSSQAIDLHTFRLDYWPRLPQSIRKRLSVSLVFAEIMGVIKGSAASRESLAPLSREEYLQKSCRLAPAFQSEDERSRVYQVFEAYESLKFEFQGVDRVDRVIKLLKVVRGNLPLQQKLGSTFEEVYIDGRSSIQVEELLITSQ